MPRLLMTVSEAAETLAISRSKLYELIASGAIASVNLWWKDIDLNGKKITITGSTAVIGGERVTGTTKSGRTRVVSIDDETSPSCVSARRTRPPSN